MATERDEWIKERAYTLWELAGRPHGQDGEHWRQANAEWEAGAQKAETSRASARLVNDFPINQANQA
ncbi:DUF2934 domain-containing protein [Rhizobium sp. XQZ8]|uniref:DUF2934 domain-containing protein n=1 Tax=Rhizobium populisoli TaxID=2859785 RepID=UPI001C669DD6|nr:DUF2934 domain-containing protein [Rhizobium populisoli]MBW6425103.1 DUF2934 domain-containing protein [Rhizobium populisoli]